MRVPAPEIEAEVAEAVARAQDNPLALAASTGLAIRPGDIHSLAGRAAELSRHVAKRDGELHAQVSVLDCGVEVDLAVPALAAQLQLADQADAPATLTLRADLRLTSTGRAVRLVQGGGFAVTMATDTSLIALVPKARRWWDVLQEAEVDIERLAAREGIGASWLTRVLRLAFLSPQVLEALLAGKLRAGVDAAVLTATGAIDASCAEQKRALLPA